MEHVARDSFEEIETTVQAAYRSSDTKGAFSIELRRGTGVPRRICLDGTTPSPLLVGSSQVCALRLEDAEVSRRHVAFELADHALLLRDLGSTNGTRVNRVRVLEALLGDGDEVEIGRTVLSIAAERSVPVVELPIETQFGRLLGQSTRMRQLYPILERLAKSSIPVVLEGETGTGKEAVAEALHAVGPRASGPFVVFDCTASAPSLLESQLFGHERGAFTGAFTARTGVFEQAHGGTLLIDEIGDLDLALQPKLLRAIERSEVRPLGGARTVRVDVRLLAATRRDLDREVQEGRFRDDLFHRLAVARVELPPLRQRQGDIALLARHFWRELSAEGPANGEPSPELLQRWEREPWPGNIRQLRNRVARALALGDIAICDELPHASLPEAADFIEQILGERLSLPVARERVIHHFERRYLARALAREAGNVTRAAQSSGIALRYFQLLRQRRSFGPSER
jgi:two-component system, NtrC family, response regulator HydG